MAYTSIFSSDMFAGLKADVMAGSIGWIGVVAAVAGAALIVRILFK